MKKKRVQFSVKHVRAESQMVQYIFKQSSININLRNPLIIRAQELNDLLMPLRNFTFQLQEPLLFSAFDLKKEALAIRGY